jgi:hypothetical protein
MFIEQPMFQPDFVQTSLQVAQQVFADLPLTGRVLSRKADRTVEAAKDDKGRQLTQCLIIT